MALTYRRIEQVTEECRTSSIGPWADYLVKALTEEEYQEIMVHWRTLSGDSCFVSAMHDLKRKLFDSGDRLTSNSG